MADVDPVAAVAEPITQGPKLAPLLPYQDPKSPNQINSVANYRKPECKRLTELESLRLNQQQQPQRFHQQGTLSYPFVKKEETCLAETATRPETLPVSSKHVTEPKQTCEHTPSAQRDSDTPTTGTIIRSSSTQLVSRTNTPPEAAKDTVERRLSDSAAYIDQCHGITPGQARESCNAPTPEQQSSPRTSTHTIPHREKQVKPISPEPVEASIPPEEQVPAQQQQEQLESTNTTPEPPTTATTPTSQTSRGKRTRSSSASSSSSPEPEITKVVSRAQLRPTRDVMRALKNGYLSVMWGRYVGLSNMSATGELGREFRCLLELKSLFLALPSPFLTLLFLHLFPIPRS